MFIGNDSDNRSDEAIASAHDLWIARCESAFGEQPRSFVGRLVVLAEDAEGPRKPTRDAEPHFPIVPEFRRTFFAARYNLLCRKFVQEE